jgi:hypothetical protein
MKYSKQSVFFVVQFPQSTILYTENTMKKLRSTLMERIGAVNFIGTKTNGTTR